MKERLLRFIDSQGITKHSFEKKCGLANGFIDKVAGYPTVKTLEKILNTFPDLNRDWLLTGTGVMLISQACEPPAETFETDEQDKSERDRMMDVLEELSNTMKSQSETIKIQAEQLADKDKKMYELMSKLINTKKETEQ